jgi:hypothetical protein
MIENIPKCDFDGKALLYYSGEKLIYEITAVLMYVKIVENTCNV